MVIIIELISVYGYNASVKSKCALPCFPFLHSNNKAFKFFVCLHGDKIYNSLFVETPRY
jgi:hypothetical protein